MSKGNSDTQSFPSKPRVFILSDISNEPDDAESLVRYLLYSNQFQTKGLVACTSTWMKRKVCPQDMEKIIHGYAKVADNLNAHVHPDCPYPTAEYLFGLIKTGPSLYGKEALGPNIPLSEGAQLLIDALDESEEPLWVLCWGGTNVIAQTLQHTNSRPDSMQLRQKLRVYAISDQDDTGAWIRLQFPDIFYINSVHGWNQYGLAAWTGISGDNYYGFDQGGPDCCKYDLSLYIGLLGICQFDQGMDKGAYPDRVTGLDGKKYSSNHATIWRWRDAYQNDFAARIQWTSSSDFAKANHAPVVKLNGTDGPAPLYLEIEAVEELTLDASGSYDLDGGDLVYEWFQYKDVTATQWWVDAEVMDMEFQKQDRAGQVVKAKLPPYEKCAVDMFTRKPVKQGQMLHFILTVKDNGTPQLTTYRRAVVQITNDELKGGGGKLAECIADFIHEEG